MIGSVAGRIRLRAYGVLMGLRADWRENPRQTAGILGGTALGYGVIAVLRPRWLTYRSRRSIEQHLRAVAVHAVLWTLATGVLLPWLRNKQRVHAELRDELGRDPTPEEVVARHEAMVADGSPKDP